MNNSIGARNKSVFNSLSVIFLNKYPYNENAMDTNKNTIVALFATSFTGAYIQYKAQPLFYSPHTKQDRESLKKGRTLNSPP